MGTRKILFYVLMGAATLGLSEFLASWRVWRAAPGPEHAARVVVLGLGLLAGGMWLGFLLYEVDRAAGRVRRRIGVYEWVIAYRVAGHRSAPPRGSMDARPAPASHAKGRG
jgi:hypothetical protein